ncbi:MAG: SPFH domain-containing protein [Kiritimatiellia bacterium]
MTDPARIPEFRDEAGEGRQALSAALRSSFRFLRILSGLLVLLYLASGVFKVEQHQVAFILRAGRPVDDEGKRALGPGVHWTWPKPFSEIVKVDATRVQTIETSAFLAEPRPGSPYAENAPDGAALRALHPVRNGYVISGDLSIVHTRCVMRYTLSDPWQAVFGVADVAAVLRNELDHAVTRIAAGRRADELLRSDVDAWRLEIEDRLRARSAALGLGVRVEGVDLSPAIPAQIERETQAVTEAGQEAARLIAEARGVASRTEGEAASESSRLLAEARSWSTQMVARTSADLSTFQALRERHAAAPAVLEDILRQEALSRVLAQVEEKFIVQDDGKTPVEIRLNLPREKPAPAKGGHSE